MFQQVLPRRSSPDNITQVGTGAKDWKERNDPYEYVDDRIESLNGQLAEYLIAREFAKEGVRTYGLEDDKSYNNT